MFKITEIDLLAFFVGVLLRRPNPCTSYHPLVRRLEQSKLAAFSCYYLNDDNK